MILVFDSVSAFLTCCPVSPVQVRDIATDPEWLAAYELQVPVLALLGSAGEVRKGGMGGMEPVTQSVSPVHSCPLGYMRE